MPKKPKDPTTHSKVYVRCRYPSTCDCNVEVDWHEFEVASEKELTREARKKFAERLTLEVLSVNGKSLSRPRRL